MNQKLKVALLLNKKVARQIFAQETIDFLHSFAETIHMDELPERVTEDYMKEAIRGADVCITCWGTPRLTEECLIQAPGLKLIAHGAGSPRGIVSEAVWKRQLRMTSASPVLSADVAETVVGLMILSLKKIWSLQAFTRGGGWYGKQGLGPIKSLYKAKIGIIAASHCGRNVIRYLQPFQPEILVYDPFLQEEDAAALGVRRVELEELMAQSDIVSLHAPEIPSTHHMIDGDNIGQMKDGAIFINTSRGSLVDEEALIHALEKGRIFACLDVTDPEPPREDHPFRYLDNVLLTPHIAGGQAENGRLRQGEFIIQQIHAFYEGRPLVYEITEKMMTFIA